MKLRELLTKLKQVGAIDSDYYCHEDLEVEFKLSGENISLVHIKKDVSCEEEYESVSLEFAL